jgi:uncharacterized protein YjiS (DUF1127 family)
VAFSGSDPPAPGPTGATARAALFDLAVARADAYLRRARTPRSTAPADLRRALEAWALKTRFASRFELDDVVRALAARPPEGEARWRGGPTGGWG